MKSIIKIKKNLISYSGSITNLFPKKVTPMLHRNYNSLNHLDNYYTTGLVTQNAQMIANVIKDVSLGDTGSLSVNNNFGSLCNHIDIIGQVNPWNITPYSIHSVFHNIPSFYNKLDPYYTTQIDTGAFNQKIYVDKRLNTTQEIICANVAPKYMSITKLSFNTNIQNINYSYKNLSGQSRPDYVGCLVTADGDHYIYYIDLKRTTLQQFEMTVLGYVPKKNIYCNIHLLGDVDQNQVFNKSLQPHLIKTYHDVYNYNLTSNDLVAMKVAKSSVPHFNYFLISRDINSWNKIPLNTPKFLTLDMLKNFYI